VKSSTARAGISAVYERVLNSAEIERAVKQSTHIASDFGNRCARAKTRMRRICAMAAFALNRNHPVCVLADIRGTLISRFLYDEMRCAKFRAGGERHSVRYDFDLFLSDRFLSKRKRSKSTANEFFMKHSLLEISSPLSPPYNTKAALISQGGL
jgi:hypothetical protein